MPSTHAKVNVCFTDEHGQAHYFLVKQVTRSRFTNIHITYFQFTDVIVIVKCVTKLVIIFPLLLGDTTPHNQPVTPSCPTPSHSTHSLADRLSNRRSGWLVYEDGIRRGVCGSTSSENCGRVLPLLPIWTQSRSRCITTSDVWVHNFFLTEFASSIANYIFVLKLLWKFAKKMLGQSSV